MVKAPDGHGLGGLIDWYTTETMTSHEISLDPESVHSRAKAVVGDEEHASMRDEGGPQDLTGATCVDAGRSATAPKGRGGP